MKAEQRNVRSNDSLQNRGGFFGGHALAMPAQKANNFKVTLKRLVSYLRPHRVNLMVVLVFAVASMVFTVAAPKITGKAMDKLKDGFVARTVLQQVSAVQQKASDQFNLFKENPQMQTDAETFQALQGLAQLPSLAQAEDPRIKAEIAQKVLELTQQGISFTQAQIVDSIRAVRETGGKIDFTYIGRIVFILIVMYMLSAVFSFVMQYMMSGVAQKTVYDLRRDVEDKLARLPLKYFDSRTHGEILSRVTNDIDTISTTLQQSITQLITSIVQIAGYIIMMLTISPILTLIVLITLPLYVFATAFVAKKSQKYFADQQQELGALSGHVEEMYTGHVIVKAFGREKESMEKFKDINNRLYTSGWQAMYYSGIMFPLMNFISNLGYVFIAVIGGIWMTRSVLNLGDITAFIQYSRSFTMPIVQTANIANVIQSTIACAERVFEILDEQEETPDSPDAKVILFPRGEVKFTEVNFRYKEDVPLIEGMNLEVKPGHTIAIVGPTGAGKTTLVNLLMRFYEIDGGKITIDGIDIKHLKRRDLRAIFGMVLQDTWLFNGTIRDNIAYGREKATEEEIIRAAKAAYADHFIRTMPDGYNTILNEEATNISQGQRQLLTIARAILADPAVLILDEATSSVDTRTELLIQRAMANLMKDRTSFVIAHRLSTIRDAELILVMNKGEIIEQGNHHELLAKDGFYAELYKSQFSGPNTRGKAI